MRKPTSRGLFLRSCNLGRLPQRLCGEKLGLGLFNTIEGDHLTVGKRGNGVKEMIRLSFVGSGTMAEAMIKIAIESGVALPQHIVASGPRKERGQDLCARYSVMACTDNRQALVVDGDEVDVVVLSVKPQVLPTVLVELRGLIPSRALVLSIVAGMKMDTLADGLAHAAVVRAMPNTPAQIGQGMTVWTSTPAVSDLQRGRAQEILQAMGEEIYVRDENQLDMATAVSGTGPTYVSPRLCWGRFCLLANRVGTWPSCAIWLPHRAAPAPMPFINSTKVACERCCPKQFGQPIKSRSGWGLLPMVWPLSLCRCPMTDRWKAVNDTP